jgi:lipid-binding SYLF domain-containing protein
MTPTLARRAAALLACAFLAACAINPTDNQKDASRKDLAEASERTLQRLYRDFPGSRRHVEGAYGYATFTNYGLKIFVVGGGSGAGIAVTNDGGAKTYMRMVEAQAGLGFGARRFQLVWVFETKSAFDQFVNSGWEVGAQATAAAARKGEGAAVEGALSISRGVWIYQMTDTGIALELAAKGTKYFKDRDLNP